MRHLALIIATGACLAATPTLAANGGRAPDAVPTSLVQPGVATPLSSIVRTAVGDAPCAVNDNRKAGGPRRAAEDRDMEHLDWDSGVPVGPYDD